MLIYNNTEEHRAESDQVIVAERDCTLWLARMNEVIARSDTTVKNGDNCRLLLGDGCNLDVGNDCFAHLGHCCVVHAGERTVIHALTRLQATVGNDSTIIAGDKADIVAGDNCTLLLVSGLVTVGKSCSILHGNTLLLPEPGAYKL